jgi:hypothetical protein
LETNNNSNPKKYSGPLSNKEVEEAYKQWEYEKKLARAKYGQYSKEYNEWYKKHSMYPGLVKETKEDNKKEQEGEEIPHGIEIPAPNIEITNDPERAYLLNEAKKQGYEQEARIAFTLMDGHCPFCAMLHGILGVENRWDSLSAESYKDIFAHFRLTHYQPEEENEAEIRQIVTKYHTADLLSKSRELYLVVGPDAWKERQKIQHILQIIQQGTIFPYRDDANIKDTDRDYEADLKDELERTINRLVTEYRHRDSSVHDKAREFMNKVYAMLQQCIIWETNDPYSQERWRCFRPVNRLLFSGKAYDKEEEYRTQLRKQFRKGDNKQKRDKRSVAAYKLHKEFLLDDRIIARLFGRRKEWLDFNNSPESPITDAVYRGMMITNQNKVENLPKWMHIMMGKAEPNNNNNE